MVKVIAKDLLQKSKPKIEFNDDFDIRKHVRKAQVNGKSVHEFIGTDDFSSAWYERQRYEVEAGREEEPILYTPFFDTVVDPSLPRNVSIHKMGPMGVVFNEVKEGGEVQFATVGGSSYSIPILHYGVGLEYNKDLVIYNETWNVAQVERQAGIAYNALLNHTHLWPIINYSYGADNLTAAVSTGVGSLPEAYVRTLESALTSARTDTTNPRRGPYGLLVSTSNLFTLERALTGVPQQGYTLQSSAISSVSTIVAYDGWSGVRGFEETEYGGVPANTAFLIDMSAYSKANFARSFFKQTLERTMGNPDVSRFILEQIIWDVYFGTYVAPAGFVEKITLPTSFSA